MGSVAQTTLDVLGFGIPAAYRQKMESRNVKAAQATKTQQTQEEAQRRMTALLQHPKQVAPQDFLAMREKQLRTMKIGLASTMTGAGGAPAPTLSAPSLTPTGQGKSKMGA